MVIAPPSCTAGIFGCLGLATSDVERDGKVFRLPAESVCIVAINPRSGAKFGKIVLQWVTDRYPRAVILALGSKRCHPEACKSIRALGPQVVQSLSETGSNRPTMIVGGGDGTLAWALSEYVAFCQHLDSEAPSSTKSDRSGIAPSAAIVMPTVAMMPIGIGNELARCLGWGSGFRHSAASSVSSELIKLDRYFSTAIRGERGEVDEWMVTTTGSSIAIGEEPTTLGDTCRRRRMLCFMSIGFLDSAISHEFASLRDTHPSMFGSLTLLNKAAYTYLGLRKGLLDSLQPVREYLSIEVDGVEIDLPSTLTTVQVLNCHSSADGVDFWGTPDASVATELQEYGPPHLADGMLEVVGTEGLVHMLSVRLRLRHSIRLAQGRKIKITVRKQGTLLAQSRSAERSVEHEATAMFAAQIDGESWEPEAEEVITVEHTQKLPVAFGWGPLVNASVVC